MGVVPRTPPGTTCLDYVVPGTFQDREQVNSGLVSEILKFAPGARAPLRFLFHSIFAAKILARRPAGRAGARPVPRKANAPER